MPGIEWTALDQDQAIEEGWCIAGYDEAPSDQIEVQRINCGSRRGDEEAWEQIIKAVVYVSSDFHTRALAFVRRVNPEEYERIATHASLMGFMLGSWLDHWAAAQKQDEEQAA